MVSTKPMGHNRVALLVDGFIIFIGTAAQVRQMLGIDHGGN